MKTMPSGAGHDAMVMAAANAGGNAVSAQPRRHQPPSRRNRARRGCGGCAAEWAASFLSGWRQRLDRIEQQNFGTRSRFASSGSDTKQPEAGSLLQTPDTFIRTPLPGAEGVEFIIHAGPQLGARFTQMTAEFAARRHAGTRAGTAVYLCARRRDSSWRPNGEQSFARGWRIRFSAAGCAAHGARDRPRRARR